MKDSSRPDFEIACCLIIGPTQVCQSATNRKNKSDTFAFRQKLDVAELVERQIVLLLSLWYEGSTQAHSQSVPWTRKDDNYNSPCHLNLYPTQSIEQCLNISSLWPSRVMTHLLPRQRLKKGDRECQIRLRMSKFNSYLHFNHHLGFKILHWVPRKVLFNWKGEWLGRNGNLRYGTIAQSLNLFIKAFQLLS